MSEQDNLLKADGIEEVKSKELEKPEDTVVPEKKDALQVEQVEENHK